MSGGSVVQDECVPATPSTVRDTNRLDFLMRHLSGRELRRLVGVMAWTGDLSEFRRAIDTAINAPSKEASHPTDRCRMEWVLRNISDFELAKITGPRPVTDDVDVVVRYLDETLNSVCRDDE